MEPKNFIAVSKRRDLVLDSGYCLSLWSLVTMADFSRQSWAMFWWVNFSLNYKTRKKIVFQGILEKILQNLWKTSLCFRIVMWCPNCWRNEIFSAVNLRCTISPRKHGYEPPKHKMPPFSQNNIFFGTFDIFL